MNNPKISVIVPVYNVEKYLPECLDTLVNQTLNDIEIIIIDDGSTDRSRQIIQQYRERDARLAVLRQENKGNGASRNTGVAMAKGKYVLFVDSDDWVLPHTCQLLYEKAELHQLDVLVFNYYLVFSHRCLERDAFIHPDIMDGKHYIEQSLKANVFSTPPWNKLIKTEIAKQMKFEVNCIYEDLEYSFAVMLRAGRVSSIGNSLYYYRRFRQGAITQRLSMRHVTDLLRVYAMIEKKLKAAGLGAIRQSPWFKIHKYEKISMEILYKLIDDADRDPDEIRDIVILLQKDSGFRRLSDFYMKNGPSVKHRLVLAAFRMSPSAYRLIGRACYPWLKKFRLAV